MNFGAKILLFFEIRKRGGDFLREGHKKNAPEDAFWETLALALAFYFEPQAVLFNFYERRDIGFGGRAELGVVDEGDRFGHEEVGVTGGIIAQGDRFSRTGDIEEEESVVVGSNATALLADEGSEEVVAMDD